VRNRKINFISDGSVHYYVAARRPRQNIFFGLPNSSLQHFLEEKKAKPPPSPRKQVDCKASFLLYPGLFPAACQHNQECMLLPAAVW
jgi:hypothetical protein